ncbi:MAG TPA: hypothetical protein VH021_18610 [Trebonia sp.]|nr:hypothetical protein [Trebonia sp.]
MASAHQARPDQVRRLLESGERRVTAAHVLPETQLAARAQYPVKLGQRGRDVGHGAQHAGDDDRVELPGARGKLRRGTLGHPDRHRNGRGRALGPAAQVGLWLHGHDLQHG